MRSLAYRGDLRDALRQKAQKVVLIRRTDRVEVPSKPSHQLAERRPHRRTDDAGMLASLSFPITIQDDVMWDVVDQDGPAVLGGVTERPVIRQPPPGIALISTTRDVVA